MLLRQAPGYFLEVLLGFRPFLRCADHPQQRHLVDDAAGQLVHDPQRLLRPLRAVERHHGMLQADRVAEGAHEQHRRSAMVQEALGQLVGSAKEGLLH